MKTKPCCCHIPGNVSCPYPALWKVTFPVNEPNAYRTAPPAFRYVSREVCSHHLEHAILDDLEKVPASIGAVTVALA